VKRRCTRWLWSSRIRTWYRMGTAAQLGGHRPGRSRLRHLVELYMVKIHCVRVDVLQIGPGVRRNLLRLIWPRGVLWAFHSLARSLLWGGEALRFCQGRKYTEHTESVVLHGRRKPNPRAEILPLQTKESLTHPERHFAQSYRTDKGAHSFLKTTEYARFCVTQNRASSPSRQRAAFGGPNRLPSPPASDPIS